MKYASASINLHVLHVAFARWTSTYAVLPVEVCVAGKYALGCEIVAGLYRIMFTYFSYLAS